MFKDNPRPEGAIEGFFKTSKHRFGLHRFGQGTLLAVYRWLVLSLIAFTLAHACLPIHQPLRTS